MATATDEHVLIYEPNQAARAAELLLAQHRGKARIEAFVASLAKAAQLHENTIWAVIIGAATIDGAEGESLERWGEIVGEFRGGLGEEDYRKFIGLRIRVNTEHPSEDAMWTVLSEAVDPSTVGSYLVADGIVYLVASEAWLDESIATHAAALIRDFRPAAIYAPIVEQVTLIEERIGTVAVPGTTIGSLADRGTPIIGKLLYSGRSR